MNNNLNVLKAFLIKVSNLTCLKSDNIPTFFYLSASFHILTISSMTQVPEKNENSVWIKHDSNQEINTGLIINN